MNDRARREVAWGFIGEVPFSEAVVLQEEIRDLLRAGRTPEHLLLLEHPPVYTLGRSARRSDIVATDAWLLERGIEVAECDRGGQVTYHGPGQLVAYPVIDLNPDRRDLRRYVRDLEETLVRTLAEYGIEAEPRHAQAEIGVWVGEAKIASIGVHISRWITTHGFALNVTTDLKDFGGIVPCGLKGVQMTSIAKEIGAGPKIEEVAEVCAGHFADVFDRELHRLPADSPARGCLTHS